MSEQDTVDLVAEVTRDYMTPEALFGPEGLMRAVEAYSAAQAERDAAEMLPYLRPVLRETAVQSWT